MPYLYKQVKQLKQGNMKYIANAFSLQMLGSMESAHIDVEKLTEAPEMADCVSVVGHPDTARVLGVEYHRVSLILQRGDVVFVSQLVGGRLPEGATTLPEGFSLVWYKVTIK